METIRPEQLKSINSPSNGLAPVFDSATNKFNWVVASGGGGANALADLTDVAISGVADGELLGYDSSIETWIPIAPVSSPEWIPISFTATYVSADSPTFIMSIAGDMTSTLSVGMKIRLGQTTDKFFIITVVGSYSSGVTLITIYGGTDFTLVNDSIIGLYYSNMKNPFGFPVDPAKWTVLVTDSTLRSQSSPADDTWYNIGDTVSQITLPIGIWYVSYKVRVYGYRAGVYINHIKVALSTANNSPSDLNWQTGGYSGTGVGQFDLGQSLFCSGIINVAAKTLLYLIVNMKTGTTGTTLTFYNAADYGHPMFISATCAYL